MQFLNSSQLHRTLKKMNDKYEAQLHLFQDQFKYLQKDILIHC